jgi:Rrf2 family protein
LIFAQLNLLLASNGAWLLAITARRRKDQGDQGSLARSHDETPMNISRSVSYAVGILLKVAQEGSAGPMTAAQIAKGAKFPPRFLYRVLRRLVDAELLHGVSGPGGGYLLARTPNKIHLLEIIIAVEGAHQSMQLHAVHPRDRGAIQIINAALHKEYAAMDRKLKRLTLAKMLRGKPGK